MKTFKVIYYMFPDAENIEITVRAKTEEEAIIFVKAYRKDPFKIVEVKE